jgi:hypothetical protein
VSNGLRLLSPVRYPLHMDDICAAGLGIGSDELTQFSTSESYVSLKIVASRLTSETRRAFTTSNVCTTELSTSRQVIRLRRSSRWIRLLELHLQSAPRSRHVAGGLYNGADVREPSATELLGHLV